MRRQQIAAAVLSARVGQMSGTVPKLRLSRGKQHTRCHKSRPTGSLSLGRRQKADTRANYLSGQLVVAIDFHQYFTHFSLSFNAVAAGGRRAVACGKKLD
jgi:hypothetical protein